MEAGNLIEISKGKIALTKLSEDIAIKSQTQKTQALNQDVLIEPILDKHTEIINNI
jgi:hypothetical protein